jgi:hypothetical protein
MNRRGFLRGTVLGGVGLVILRNSSSVWSYQANRKLGIALVGVGGRGKWFVDTIPKMENVVAFCDVNEKRAEEAYKLFPDTKKHHDFRKMLEEMDKQIDAIIVATPDHTHAVASVTAMKAGKHVYCEKPLTRDVQESRVMRETAKKCKVATQMGNQGTASAEFRRALDHIRAGTLGEVREVHVWNDAGGPGTKQAPQGSQPVPDYLKWDLWLGPAADRPYHSEWMKWHGWRDFGTGQLGNWAMHTANLAFMALKVDSLWYAEASKEPKPVIRIEAKASEINTLSLPRWEVVRYEIPARGDLPPVVLTWHNGHAAEGSRDLIEALLGRGLDWGDKGEKKWKDYAGALIVGSKGKIYSTGHNATFSFLPEDQFKDVKDPQRALPRSPGHEREWLDACKGGPPAVSNFDYSGPLAEFLLLGNVATQFEGKLEFDPLACKITNNEKANQALRREYRKGWSL